MKKIALLLLLYIIPTTFLSSQEEINSIEEKYYDFLAVQGLTERPTLNYRTLSDSVWYIANDIQHPWQKQNLGKFYQLFGDFRLRSYGPELFMSVNTAAPYGQNDGVLWQGRGFNASVTGGVRFEGYGLELTLKPQIAFSQNSAFDYIKPAYSGDNYINKAERYGYHGVISTDAPQRFGDKSFFDWDFGDSEIRYTWKTLTVGFGTQPIWLGPAQLNPIIHSNNAPSYPKLDIGLRRQSIIVPKLHWHIGDIEFRTWWGYLSESKWFDNDGSNNNNLITGLSIAYSFPYLLRGLTVGFNRIMLSKWDNMNYGAILSLLVPRMSSMGFGDDQNDQRASIIIDYLLPIAHINIYFEWGRNDYSPDFDYLIVYPFHTQGYTLGVKKNLSITDYLKGEILLEITGLECSQDYDRVIPWASTFYSHHIITQGHTNRGQWLGAGIGTGGNSQYLGFKLFFPNGYGTLFVQRRNPDLDYTWYIDSKNTNDNTPYENIRLFLDIGLSGCYYFTPDFSLSSSLVFRDEYNPLNKTASYLSMAHRYNIYLAASVKYSF